MKTSRNNKTSASGVSRNKKAPRQVLKLILGTVIFFAVGTVQADSRENDESQQIEGTWVIAIDPPGPVPPTHIAFGSFAKGGTFTGSADNFLPPFIGVMGTAFGSWKHLRGDKYASTIAAFTFNAAGQLTGTVKLNANYTLTRNGRFTGESQLFFCDVNLVCSTPPLGIAQLSGQRLEIEPVTH